MEYIIDNIENFNEDEILLFLNKIPKAKREKIDNYKNKQRRKQSIVAEMILSNLLYKNGINYDEIKITYNENGKPYISNFDLYFNISHSYNFVLVAISKNEIGVDIEKIRNIDKRVSKKISKEPSTEKILCKSEDILKAFVLKEAYLKLRGWPFSKLDEIKVKYNEDDIELDDKTCCYTSIINPQEYIAYICECKQPNLPLQK